MLSGYRLMWMMIMFDLPVTTKLQRSRATHFRKFLLDQGFAMSQFSVYFRLCGDRSKIPPYVRKIEAVTPPEGTVSMLFFTDKQFSEIITIERNERKKPPEKPDQLSLF